MAGGTARFVIVYEAGPLGIAEGGRLLLQVSPFWGWSTPQAAEPAAPGFTTVETRADGVRLETDTLDQQLLGIRVGGRGLAAGERVRITYGAGAAGASVDRYAESGSRFWIGVDGDGDGVRGLIAESPGIDVRAGPPAALVATQPRTARPREPVRLVVAVLDAAGNAGTSFAGALRLVSEPDGLTLPGAAEIAARAGGRAEIAATATREGVFRVAVSTADGASAESNPLRVAAGARRILWGDLHGHSQVSDGTGTPDEYYRYARDVAGLDVAALTDHDHWGMRPLSQDAQTWRSILAAADSASVQGRFLALAGFEWTSWIHGHRNVVYFGGEREVFSSIDPAYETPRQLWDALRGRTALTFSHHSAGGPIATDWGVAPDPVLEPDTEIVSVHGSSEAADTPGGIYDPVPGNYVRDALGRGYVLGFVGSGDSHDGHPGLPQLAGPCGGLAAILADEPTGDAVLAALRGRHVYATNGPRIVLDVRLAGHSGGAVVAAADLGDTVPVDVEVVATAPLERIDVIRTGRIVASVPVKGRQAREQLELRDLAAGEYVYVRVVQLDGGAAWSSPVNVR